MTTAPPPKRLRIHPSILTSLCWKAVEFRYVRKVRRPSSVDQTIGRAAHKTYRTDLAYTVGTKERLAVSEIRDQAADDFEHEWNGKDGVDLYLPEEREAGLLRTKGRAKDATILYAETAHRTLAPTITGVRSVSDLERRIDLRVAGAPFDLSGVIDVVERGKRVRDTKTRKGKPKENELEGSIQLSFYSLALERYGEPVKEIGLDVIQKLVRPKTHSLFAPAPTDHRPLLERIRVASGIFETGLFYPIDPNSQTGKWACTERFCDHFDICPFGRARRTSVTVIHHE